MVSNVYGEAATVISLEVSGVPDPPTQFKADSATHSSITLSWKMDFTGGAKLEELVGLKHKKKPRRAKHSQQRSKW